MHDYAVMNPLLILAILLALTWVILRVALAVTGFFLHLLWIAAIVLVAVWLIRKLTSKV